MERRVINFADATRVADAYRVKVAYIRDVADHDLSGERSLGDKCLGIATMVVISALGWAAIIELVRHLW
jgi:hypothetical protein